MNPKEIIKKALMKTSALFNNNRGSKILYYHDVFRTINYRALDADIYMGTPFELFARHIDAVRSEGYELVPKITLPKGQVAIMLDDGFRGIYECRDYFSDNGIFPTVFLPAGYVGEVDKGLLSKAEILELQAHGFSFECHGWSHRPLTNVPENDLKRELIESKTYLENFLDKKVSGLCMPLGYFTCNLINRIKQAGYTEIYSCIPGCVTGKPFGLITRNLCQYASPEEVRLILRGGNEILKKHYLKLHCHG
ncbi:MAG: polysaccharide deacetylase family protein [Bacteroides sp.]|nr:polysaccharide deacetylase family protein [Bacteroides sp.]